MSQPPALNPPAEQSNPYLAAWIVALALIGVFVLGLLMYPPVFTEIEGAPKATDSVLFVGRFHPIIVHLPVGALMLLVLIELICLTRRGAEMLEPAALLILLVGAAGSVAAVLVGIMLSREGGYQGANFTLHQTIGIGGTTGILIALTLRISAMGSGHGGVMDCYRIMFFLSFAFLSLGAHFGGNMSHGSKFLSEYAPPAVQGPMVSAEKWLLSLAGKPEDAAVVEPVVPPPPAPLVVVSNSNTTPVTPTPEPPTPPVKPIDVGGGAVTIEADDSVLVFQHLILPLLDAKCNKCHGEEKQKGDLRMDTLESLLKGGEGEPGKTIIPGKPDDSLAILRLKLPIDDDEHMPPEGKDQMEAEETALLHWWIQEGASETLKVKDAKIPPQMKPFVESLLKK